MKFSYCFFSLTLMNIIQVLNVKKTNSMICNIQLLKVLMHSPTLFSFKTILYGSILNKKKSFIK